MCYCLFIYLWQNTFNMPDKEVMHQVPLKYLFLYYFAVDKCEVLLKKDNNNNNNNLLLLLLYN